MKMAPDQLVMLVFGVLLFVVALVYVVSQMVRGRSFKGAFILFVLAIALIGFPRMKSIKVLGAEFELNQSLAAIESNPDDPSARARVEQAVNALEARVTPSNSSAKLAKQLARGNEVLGRTEQALRWATAAQEKSPNSAKAREIFDRVQVQKLTPTDLNKPVSPQEQSDLNAAVSRLKQQPNLAPESRVTLAKAQLALGQTNEAAANVDSALKVKPNLKVDRNLRALVPPSP
jgi:Tfp pilus assembly protein PilF